MRLHGFILFAAASGLSAQSGRVTAHTADTAVITMGSPAAGCPVDFTARRSSGGGLVQTRPDAPSQALGYTVTLGANPLNPRVITQARIILHGLSGVQVVPAAHGDAHRPSSEEFSIAPRSTDRHSFHSVVYPRTLTGVQSVELNELLYADGTHWHESAESPCRISPNGFMLVASAR